MGARRFGLLAAAAVAYWAAAWAVAPGFFDGFAPPPPYNWVTPPPQFRNGNHPPNSGHNTFTVAGDGRVNPGIVATQDGQASISFIPGAFVAPPDRAPVTIIVRPTPKFPSPGAIRLDTNVYCVTASSPIAPGQEVLVFLRFSTGVPAPGAIYQTANPGPWRALRTSNSAIPFTIASRTGSLGCFAGGYLGSPSGGGISVLPIIVGAIVVIVVLAAIPIVLIRRS